MRFRPTKIHLAFLCFILTSISLNLGCSKDSDLLLDSIINESVSTVEEKEKTTPQEENTEEESLEEIEDKTKESSSDNLESRTTSFSPTNDAYIQNGKGYNQNTMQLEEDHRTSYLMFDLSPIGTIQGNITKVSLQFTIDSDNGNGNIKVFKGDSNEWKEEDLSEHTAPIIQEYLGGIIKEYEIGITQIIELDAEGISSEISTLILRHENGNNLAFASKEHNSKIGPKLVVTYDVEKDTDEIVINEEKTEEETNEEPVAVADATPSSGGAPLAVTFKGDTSSDDTEIVSYNWEFKDGSSATSSNPTHTFTKIGVYEVELTVSDAQGLTNTDKVTITVTEPENEAPKAVASATPIAGEVPLEVSFKGSDSTDDNSISAYAWDFKDGSNGDSANPKHTYTKAGTYLAELTVTDENGLSNKATVTITVTEPKNEAPKAVASATPIAGEVPLEVSFKGSDSTDDNSISAYAWDFKDGSNGDSANPKHTYTKAGTYLAELTVTDENGLSNKATVTITVTEPKNEAPIAVATANPRTGTAPLNVQFIGNNSTDDKEVTSYTWNFKDGATATTANPSHKFIDAGTYQVELTVKDKEGLSNKKTVTITVNAPQNQPPVAFVTANPISGQAPLEVQFLGDGSTDDKGISSYFWDFKDGATTTNINPSHTFTEAGSYVVDLIVKDAEGASNKKSITINVTAANNNNGGGNAPPGYYVTPNGKSTNNGKSESSAWSLEYALRVVNPGDIVYVKSGTYNHLTPVSSRSGTSGNPIKFIGYTKTPGDLQSNGQSSYNYGDQLNPSIMPLVKGLSNTQGVGIDLNGNYFEIHNFQITNYEIGILAKGRHTLLKNVIVTNTGIQNNNSSQTGRGIQIQGDNTIVENSFILNANAEGINIRGGNNCIVRDTKVYSDNYRNMTGYYIAITGGGRNNLIERCVANRDAKGDNSYNPHQGHGFIMKDRAVNNTVKNSKTYNTGVEVNFSGVYSNTFENIEIIGNYLTYTDQYSSCIRINNGAHDNTFRNISIKNTRYAVHFNDYDDGFTGGGGDENQGGNNNKFININVDKANNILFFSSSEIGWQATSKNNQFSNSSFNNIRSIPFITYQTTIGTAFTNCTFKNIPHAEMKKLNGGAPNVLPIVFANCNFINIGFPKPN